MSISRNIDGCRSAVVEVELADLAPSRADEPDQRPRHAAREQPRDADREHDRDERDQQRRHDAAAQRRGEVGLGRIRETVPPGTPDRHASARGRARRRARARRAAARGRAAQRRLRDLDELGPRRSSCGRPARVGWASTTPSLASRRDAAVLAELQLARELRQPREIEVDREHADAARRPAQRGSA